MAPLRLNCGALRNPFGRLDQEAGARSLANKSFVVVEQSALNRSVWNHIEGVLVLVCNPCDHSKITDAIHNCPVRVVEEALHTPQVLVRPMCADCPDGGESYLILSRRNGEGNTEGKQRKNALHDANVRLHEMPVCSDVVKCKMEVGDFFD